MLRTILIAVVPFALVAALFVFKPDFSPPRERLVIGYAEEPPYAFALDNGTVTGESPEVAKVIAARLGVADIEWRVVEFGNLIGELEAGRIDLIAAGMFITPERAGRVAFSEPTFRVQSGLLVAEGNPFGLHAYADVVANSAVRIVVLEGSLEERMLRNLGLSADRLVRVPDALTGRVAVESGQAQCLALSRPSLRWMVRSAPGTVELSEPFSPPEDAARAGLGYGGFAFRLGDTDRLRLWNSELDRFVGSIEHLSLVEPFGFTFGDMPDRMTTREVLGQ